MEDELISRARTGSRRAIAQLLTLVENDQHSARRIIQELYAETGKAHVIGVTGPPGCGKSTLVNEIAKELRKLDAEVAIVAVDPSSPFTGGALLGDRVRMQDLSGDKGIFIRSMASRGSLGGLAHATSGVVKVLDAVGFQRILVETVGAGQAEVDIANAAHTTLVVEAPGMGDEIQTIKAGILEIADILIVNKMDRAGSERAVAALQMMLHMGSVSYRMDHHGQQMTVAAEDASAPDQHLGWDVPVAQTIATENRGIVELTQQIESHRQYLQHSGKWFEREMVRSRREVEKLLQDQFLQNMRMTVPDQRREELIKAVAQRQVDPYTAVEEIYELAAVV